MKPLLTIKEVCEQLSVSQKTVYKMHSLGLLPRIEITPQTIRYRQSDVDRLIERRTLI